MRTVLALACAVLLPCPAASSPRADFYVSPNGNDRWSGRLAQPNRQRTDGPFATIHRARDAVRAVQAEDPRARTVLLRAGLYSLREPLRLGPEDSGTARSPITYAAYPGEAPVLSGGVRLSGWKVGADGWWRLSLPEVHCGEWVFQQLWVDGERRFRTRLPRRGFWHIADALPPSPRAEGKGFDQFRFEPGQLSAAWHSLRDVEALVFQTWTMARLRIDSLDEAQSTVRFTGRTLGTVPYQALPKGNRFLIENVREALGEPGTFYLDRADGELIYVPRPGESPEKSTVIAPRLERLVELAGDPARRAWVRNVRMRGITFAHTNWVTPPEGNVFYQAEVHLGGAVTATGARGCVLEDCRITHTGAWAVDLGAGCKSNRVVRCRLADLGAGGVKIGEMAIRDDEEQVASHNTVRECQIVHAGRLHPAAIGVWIGQSHHNEVADCEIGDLYYTGVSVGWTWGYGRSLATHNHIVRNHIHHIGQGVLSDMGGIYTLGVSPGTVLRGNHIHDVESFGYGGWGIYPDEGSTGLLIEDNLVHRTKSAGFHQHYGRENVVRNNVFAYGREAQIMRTRAEEHLSFTMEGNIVLWSEGPLLGSNWSGNNYKLDRNLYWKEGGAAFDFAGMTLEQWRAKGQDVHSVVADPLFVDPKKGDFRLRPGSPAGRIGFRPFAVPVSARPARPAPGFRRDD